MRKEDPLIQEFIQLHQSEDFKRILTRIRQIIQTSDKELINVLRLLTWPSPTESDLEFLSRFVHSSGITHVYSIGCGTGLLEWLMMKSLQAFQMDKEQSVTVTGIEIDFGWWSSIYSPPMFLPLRFVDKDFNAQESFGDPSDMAFFCYFNNLKVFLDYLHVFHGEFVAILGPVGNVGQFCAPGPLELVENPEMPCAQWELLTFRPFGLGNVDHIAIYRKAKA